jgi:hypothetical protein
MNSLTDFDCQSHRTVSAAVAFQKGLYHLFILQTDQTDSYGHLIRSYQCVFQLCVTLVLLDGTFSLTKLLKTNAMRGLAKKVCADPEKPGRNGSIPLAYLLIQQFRSGPGSHQLTLSHSRE